MLGPGHKVRTIPKNRKALLLLQVPDALPKRWPGEAAPPPLGGEWGYERRGLEQRASPARLSSTSPNPPPPPPQQRGRLALDPHSSGWGSRYLAFRYAGLHLYGILPFCSFSIIRSQELHRASLS